ncbi:type VI secretion system baseplate subunit TssG [Alienimonas californiensis]|uniref:Type VI secretion protein, VC_A0111 family n=1 Tax=Alienimonas californiensis TaxID=2527989 RepID=A0A517P4J0_9PLAN|nr:type VI secretion system baseplate subunit TssG [Alienimonas californiensis]QDT14265.1 hypothetical protein CA12_03360 [Alienimonas californiensis]
MSAPPAPPPPPAPSRSAPPSAASKPYSGDPDRDPDLGRRLLRDGSRFEFFQAVRLLTKLRPGRGPDPTVLDETRRGERGRAGEPDLEPVCRFRTRARLDFPASSIDLIEPPTPPRRSATGERSAGAGDAAADPLATAPRVWLNHFGLVGASGVLPRHYTELIQQRRRDPRDSTLHEFLDLFTHRLAGLFYRAWVKYRPWAAHERAAAGEATVAADPARRRAYLTDPVAGRPADDPAGDALLAIAGLAGPASRLRESVRHAPAPRLALSDDRLRYYAGLLAGPNRSAAGLEVLLRHCLTAPVTVQTFVGQWLHLDPEDRCQLSSAAPPRLGRDAVVGARVRDAQGRFRVVIGPLSLKDFCSLLPDGAAHRVAADLVRLYAGPEFDFDFELRLRSEETPALHLGGPHARLGYTTWSAAGEGDAGGMGRADGFRSVVVPIAES